MNKSYVFVFLLCICLIACGGKRATKPTPKPAPPTTVSKTEPAVSAPAPSITLPPNETVAAPTPTEATSSAPTSPGGYYLDDGPGENPPNNIDALPDAIPKKEPLLTRSNKPYKALGKVYTPMTSYRPYKERGIASWYGKRFHGKKTSSGEIYDMYGMSAAHTTLPLPSYVKVTNPANGRSVIVRVNDRGPFKHSRLIDLSYAAAHKLRFTAKGSTMVEVEAIDTNNLTQYQAPTAVASTTIEKPTNIQTTSNSTDPSGYFVQAGAFKNESNAETLLNKIQALEIGQNAGVNRVYNDGLYRLKLGPFDNKTEANQVAAEIRKQLNISAIITNQ